MTKTLRRIFSLFLILALLTTLFPAALAAETETTASTEAVTEPTTEPTTETIPEETAETVPPETVPSTVETTPPTTEATEAAEETQPDSSTEEELSLSLMSLDDGIATLAETEIVGQPNAFGNLFLINGGIDIPSFGQIQHKEHLPLYSVYLKNQPGYENNYYVAYCIEPGIFLGESGGHSGSSSTVGGMTEGVGALHYLTRQQVEAMGVVLLYGQKEIARRADEESYRLEKLCRHAATQAIIWEIAAGWRSATPPYTLYDSTLYDAITPRLECAVQVWGTKFYLDGMDDAYDELAAQIESHYTIPSFMSSRQSSAPAYEMTRNSDGTYSITLRDSNYVLSQYRFSGTSGLSFSVSGNRLTITSSTPFTGKTIVATKQVPDLDNQVFYIWEHEEQQKLMSCKTDPSIGSVPAYFSLTAPDPTGNLNLVKTTEDGKNLSNWRFALYSDFACTNLTAGPYTTNSSGKIAMTGIPAGIYYVKELGHSSSATNALYICASANPQKVTISSGTTASVSFHNKLVTGSVKLIKDTNTGNNRNGWQIGLYTNSACTSAVSGSPFTTGADGTITVSGLKPGTYYAKELPGGDSYWACDTSVKTVTVKANAKTSVTFTNTHYGRIAVQKHTNTGNHLSGWPFQIRDNDGNVVAELVTDEQGYAVTGNLPLGRYIVQELPTEDDYWQVELGFHDVTVKAGEIVTDEWTNVEQGLGWFYKKTNTGESVEGWKITVYSDPECTQEVHTLTTNEDGRAGYYMDPGTYWAKETGDTEGRFESEYWLVDERVQEFEIKPHEDTSITFTNIQYGKLRIVKTMASDGSLEGWPFKVTDSSGAEVKGSPFLSSADGTILTENLLPGEYTVEELIPEGSLYYCKSENPQTVTVIHGMTAEVQFTNALRPGKLVVHKVDSSHKEALAGAKFLLEWSLDEVTWEPVRYSDKEDVVLGGCGNADAADGCLTTGEDGTIQWDNLYPGIFYRLTEVEAPEGYALLTHDAYNGQLPEDDLEVTIRVVNSRGFALPETGSHDLLLFQAFTVCAYAALIFLSIQDLRRKEANEA